MKKGNSIVNTQGFASPFGGQMNKWICTFAFLFYLPISTNAAETAENTLAIWASQYLKGEQNEHPPISVGALAKYENNEPFLNFKLTNTSNRDVAIGETFLPWAHIHNISLAAFSPSGRRLANFYPIDDPVGGKTIVLRPGDSLEGKYRLSDMIVFDARSKKEETIILWTYQMWDYPRNKAGKLPVLAGAVVFPAFQKK